MKNDSFFITIIASLLLASCMPKYDIDVECLDVDQFGIENISENVRKFDCDTGDNRNIFSIRCDAETMQWIEDYIYCSTKDGKSVRIYIPNS